MISLSDVTSGVQEAPVLAVVYGPPGIGKSTLAANAPKPIFLATENGTNNLDVKRVRFHTFEDLLNLLKNLTHDKHPYETVAIDTITGLQEIVYRSLCERNQKKNIEEFGYGKGYVFAHGLWLQLVAALETLRAQRGVHLLLVGHEAVKRVPNPSGADFEQKVPDLYKTTNDLFYRWSDNCFHLTYKMGVVVSEKAIDKTKGKGVSTGARVVRCQWRPDAVAKNRYHLPYELPLEWETLWAAIKASGDLPGAIDAFTDEARASAHLAGTDDEIARCRARIEACAEERDLSGLQRIVNFLRGKLSIDSVTT